ncbi:hypothetical protein KI387_036479, partial [Taxus chinensis]
DMALQQEGNNIPHRLESLKKHMMQLKKDLQCMDKKKGERNIDDDTPNGNYQIADIYKKLNSLENRLGRSKDKNDHNMVIFNAISDFLEQH